MVQNPNTPDDFDGVFLRALVEFIMWSKLLHGDLGANITGDAALEDGYATLRNILDQIQSNRSDESAFTDDDRRAIADAVARWHLYPAAAGNPGSPKVDFSSTSAALAHLTDQQGVPLDLAAVGMCLVVAGTVRDQIGTPTALEVLRKVTDQLKKETPDP